MTQAPTTRSFDPGLTGYRYPRAVQFYAFQAQAQTLRMAYMCAEPESSNQKSVLLLHGKNFSGAYWQPTIRELLREGFRVIEPDQIGFGKSSKPHCYQFTEQLALVNPIGLKDWKALGVPYRTGLRKRARDTRQLPRTGQNCRASLPTRQAGGERRRRHLPPIETCDHYSQALFGFVTSEEG